MGADCLGRISPLAAVAVDFRDDAGGCGGSAEISFEGVGRAGVARVSKSAGS